MGKKLCLHSTALQNSYMRTLATESVRSYDIMPETTDMRIKMILYKKNEKKGCVCTIWGFIHQVLLHWLQLQFLVQEYFSMEVLIVICLDKWTSRNRTTTDIDENSFYVFIALHEMISVFMKLHISKIWNMKYKYTTECWHYMHSAVFRN